MSITRRARAVTTQSPSRLVWPGSSVLITPSDTFSLNTNGRFVMEEQTINCFQDLFKPI